MSNPARRPWPARWRLWHSPMLYRAVAIASFEAGFDTQARPQVRDAPSSQEQQNDHHRRRGNILPHACAILIDDGTLCIRVVRTPSSRSRCFCLNGMIRAPAVFSAVCPLRLSGFESGCCMARPRSADTCGSPDGLAILFDVRRHKFRDTAAEIAAQAIEIHVDDGCREQRQRLAHD